jgi:hypothetical protein
MEREEGGETRLFELTPGEAVGVTDCEGIDSWDLINATSRRITPNDMVVIGTNEMERFRRQAIIDRITAAMLHRIRAS